MQGSGFSLSGVWFKWDELGMVGEQGLEGANAVTVKEGTLRDGDEDRAMALM